jgi:hypothetical protein
MAEASRWLVLGTAFAIDLDFFENRGRGGGIGFGYRPADSPKSTDGCPPVFYPPAQCVP